MPIISYLGRPEDFVQPFESINASEALLKCRDFFDYAGGIFLPKELFASRLKLFPTKISKALEAYSCQNNGKVHLRSGEYYLNFRYYDDEEEVRKALPQRLLEVTECIDSLSETALHTDLESRLMAASLLDHKKHYSMCLLNAFFTHMLTDSLEPRIYECAEKACVRDIANFYQFLLTGKLIRQGHFSGESLDAFIKKITLPKPKTNEVGNPFAEPGASKMVVREMDHPLQIIFFAGHLLNQDNRGVIHFAANPLSGALEVGYALRAIYTAIGQEKIGEVLLIKYSRHGEGHRFRSSLDQFIPPHLMRNLKKIKGKRVLIIDDNTFYGDTLLDLKRMFSHYSDKVGIAAIERRTDSAKGRLIALSDLDVKPVSKLRYIGKVLNFVKNNNLRNFEK